jgi:predicted RNA binding protein YcfA (HicA-like mRNA interferase family)
MPRKLRELRADLRRAGWIMVRQTGSHQIWKHPDVPGEEVNLPGHDGEDALDWKEKRVQKALKMAREAQRRRREP